MLQYNPVDSIFLIRALQQQLFTRTRCFHCADRERWLFFHTSLLNASEKKRLLWIHHACSRHPDSPGHNRLTPLGTCRSSSRNTHSTCCGSSRHTWRLFLKPRVFARCQRAWRRLDSSSRNRLSPMTFLPPHRTSSPMCAVPAERAIHTGMLGFWRSTFMQSNFLLQPNFLPLLHCSEHRKQLQIFPSGARRHTMAKLCLEVSCHHQSVTAFLEQHPCHWTFFGAQGQHTPMPKGKGRDRINIAVGGRLIWMRADSMIFVVIIPVPQQLPRLVKPSGTQVSILKSFIVLHQCGVP